MGLRRRVSRNWRGVMVTALSRLFRYGTPALVAPAAIGQVSWWFVLVPVVPVWCSFITSMREAQRRARIIRRPNRPMRLDEAAAERRFLVADAEATTAAKARIAALCELAVARADGDARTDATNSRQRSRPFVERTRRRRKLSLKPGSTRGDESQ